MVNVAKLLKQAFFLARDILGDPGADSGARESRKGQKKNVGEEKFRLSLAPLSAPGSPRM